MRVKRVASKVAPRLHHRRLVRIYFFPWILCVCTFIIVAISGHIGTNPFHVLFIWATLVLCFVLKDLTSPYSLITRFYYNLGDRLGFNVLEGKHMDDESIVFLNYNDPPLLKHRVFARWSLYLWIIIILNIYAGYQSQNPSSASTTERTIVTFFIILFNLLIFSRFISMPVDLSRPYRVVVWTIVIMGTTATVGYCMYQLTFNYALTLNASIVAFFVFLSFFAGLRLSADSQTLKEVLDELVRDLLSWPQTKHNLNGAATRIGKELRHDRVFILMVEDARGVLQVKDQYGVQRSLYDLEIPLLGSICGRAYRERKPILWNNVRLCSDFYEVADDDTTAEVALPITYRDEIYGVLDVQSLTPDVFGPTDLDALITVAEALGTALAASRSETFFDEALSLWKQLDEAMNEPFPTEEHAFNLFAEFAHDRLKADLVIYFPLTLSGCPVSLPYKSGEFISPDPLQPPKNHRQSSLTKLIEKWHPVFEESILEKSDINRLIMNDDGISLVTREETQSACFIPVGIRSERTGALFLIFRQQQRFDKIFKFTCLSFAQSLAKATAQVRYRDVLYNSFGRPEISLHNILGRHGLKEGVVPLASSHWQMEKQHCCPDINNCALYPVLDGMDDFLTEISLAESSIPPNFWHDNLESKLRNYTSSLPHQKNGRRPQIELKIDPLIERENSWVKLAFYRVITEAVNNAILHGEATSVQIIVERKINMLHLCVENNGLPLPQDARQSASSNGIYRLLSDLENRFGAEDIEVVNKDDGKGARVAISIPVISKSSSQGWK